MPPFKPFHIQQPLVGPQHMPQIKQLLWSPPLKGPRSVPKSLSGLQDTSSRSRSTPKGEIPDVLLVWKNYFNCSLEVQLWVSLEGLGKTVTEHIYLFV